MTTYRVLALDPGGTTGWATYTATVMHDPDGNAEYYKQKYACGQFGPEEHHQQLYEFLESQRTSLYSVVCESFEFRQGRQRNNLNLMSKEYIGTLKTYSQIEQVSVVFQTAAVGKSFVDDKKLKVMGLWFPRNKHAMDAMRHLVTYLVQKERRYDLIEKWKELA